MWESALPAHHPDGSGNIKPHILALEAELATGGPYLIGEQYTLADASWGALLLRLDETGWLEWFADTLKLQATPRYYAALRARPSWVAAIEDQRHPVIDAASVDLRTALGTNAELREHLYG